MKSAAKGDVIFKSKPFAYVLCNKERGVRCDACLERKENLKRCTRCSFAWYCDRNCQHMEWQNHKEECLAIKKISPHIPTDFTRLMARIILKLQKRNTEKFERINEDIIRNFDDLMSHNKELLKDEKRNEEFALYNTILREFIGYENLPPMKDLYEIFGKVVINTFSIADCEMQSIGIGLYIGASILDHSCCPNAVAMFSGPNLSVNLTTSIPDFDISKVFISYIDILATKDERDKKLYEQYYFHCSCKRCGDKQLEYEMQSLRCPNEDCNSSFIISEKDVNDNCTACGQKIDVLKGKNALEVLSSVNSPLEILNDLKKAGNFHKLLEKAQTFLSTYRILHNLNIYYIRGLDLAFDACITLQRWEDAIKYGILTLSGYRKYYGAYHPNLGIQLMKIGKLFQCLDEFESALDYLSEAKEIIGVSHTKQHPLYHSLLEMVQESEMCKLYKETHNLNKC